MVDQDLLITIREIHTEISWLQPYRDLGLIPNPAASEVAINKAQKRLGRRLPPSYRAFLMLHDGWPRFFDGASLLGTANLGRRKYEDLARAAFEAAETPVPLGPPPRPIVVVPRRTSPSTTVNGSPMEITFAPVVRAVSVVTSNLPSAKFWLSTSLTVASGASVIAGAPR